MRFMRIEIQMNLFLGMLVEHQFIDYKIRISKGLPEDCKFCYTYPTRQYGMFNNNIKHSNFKELKDGEEIPKFDILFEQVEK